MRIQCGSDFSRRQYLLGSHALGRIYGVARREAIPHLGCGNEMGKRNRD